MSNLHNARIAQALYEAFNRRDFDRALDVIDPACESVQVPTGEVIRGREGFRRNMQRWVTAFTDARIEVLDIVADENSAAVQFIGRGTHTGPLVTPMGEIPASGREAEIRFCEVLHIFGGRITRGFTYFDLGSLLQQVGTAPGAAVPSTGDGDPARAATLLRQLFERVINGRELGLSERYIASGFVSHGFPMPEPGPMGFRRGVSAFLDAFPDLRIAVDEYLPAGARVATRGRWTGTHRGEFLGIRPTGRRVEVRFIDLWLERDGRLVENWVQMDFLGLTQQLGAPAPAAPAPLPTV